MMNYIWAGLMLVSIVVSLVSGRADALGKGIIDGAGEGISLIINLAASMCFWSGIMNVARKAGMINRLSRLLSPVTGWLFKNVPKSSAAMDAIIMNMSANMLGMGNAATPFGLSAMKELDKLNGHRKTASADMCLFVIINTASIQLIPTTIISIRQQLGSENAAVIILPCIAVSFLVAVIGVALSKALGRGDVP